MIMSEPETSSPVQRTNRLAVVALILGIVSFYGLFPVALVAIILGHKAKREISQTGEDGRSLANTGIILGCIGVVIVPLLIVFLLFFLGMGLAH